MLATAGFVDIGFEDLTTQYRDTQAGWIAAFNRREPEIRAIRGDQVFVESQEDRVRTLASIDSGILSRYMFWATNP